MVTTVPPSTGPDHGATARTNNETNSKDAPLDVYSRPFVLTSTDTRPGADAVTLQSIIDSLAYAAGTMVPLKRQRSAPNDSAADEKPLPSTVSGVPPSAAPLGGHTDDTAATGRYVKKMPSLCANCCPFADSASRRAPAAVDDGEAHSSWLMPTTLGTVPSAARAALRD